MANRALFPGKGRQTATDTRNEAGGRAYRLSPKQALAQYAATGCLSHTYYADAQTQLDEVLRLCTQVEPAFIAQTAIWARREGQMKDMPALLTAYLAVRGKEWLPETFAQVIDNGRMLRNFVQILRSGVLGRRSLGSLPKRLVQQWLNNASEQQLLHAAVGNAPSLADVVKMVHPKPIEAWRSAFFAWLIGKPYVEADLPEAVRAFERYKREGDAGGELPEVPFQLLTAQPLSDQAWAQIAQRGGWQMVRMNLNSFARHGVYALDGMDKQVAAKLRNPRAIAKARVLPYQLLTAYKAATEQPKVVRAALAEAMQTALANVPELSGRVVVCPDVSGSMSMPATGWRKGATSVTRCIDVAALVAAAVLERNPTARVMPFDLDVVKVALDARKGVLKNADTLSRIQGGGTDISAPLRQLVKEKAAVDLLILVSDNESWMSSGRHRSSDTLAAWEQLKALNPGARLVCLDIQPYATTQAPERADILNIGGFSDAVFGLIALFAQGKLRADHWVGVIEAGGARVA